MKKLYMALAAILALGVYSCTEELPQTPEPEPEPAVEVEGVTINPSSLELIEGDSELLTVTIQPQDATDSTFLLISADEEVAVVDTACRVTAVAPGQTVIIAVAGKKTAKCKVTVVPRVIHVTGVSISQSSAELKVGETLSLSASIAPLNATDTTYRWVSNKPKVAKVDENGVVTALSAGVATIKVKSNDGDLEAACEVTVISLSSSEMWNAGQTLKIGSQSLSKSSSGLTAKFITSSDATDGVYTIDEGLNDVILFVESDVTIKFASGNRIYNTVAIVGNGAKKTPMVVDAAVVNCGTESKLLLKNIDFDATAKYDAINVMSTYTMDLLLFDGCSLAFENSEGKRLLWDNSSRCPVANLEVVNSDWEVTANNQALLSCHNNSATWKSIVFKNNLVWSKSKYQPRLMINNDANVLESVSICGNSFINVDNSNLFTTDRILKVEIKDNLVYCPYMLTANGALVRGDSGMLTSDNITVEHNGLWAKDTNAKVIRTVWSSNDNCTVLDSDPFETVDLEKGVFVKKSSAEYGATNR